MTSKHLKILAGILRDCKPELKKSIKIWEQIENEKQYSFEKIFWNEMLVKFIVELKKNNSRFDELKFRTACGFYDD
jgi:hypothetical protein